jgi:hypothetical protein
MDPRRWFLRSVARLLIAAISVLTLVLAGSTEAAAAHAYDAAPTLTTAPANVASATASADLSPSGSFGAPVALFRGFSAAEEVGPALRTDIQLSEGRGGGAVKSLTGPRNSIVRGAAGRIYQTDSEGRVVADITAGRVKPVTPGQGFGPKRPPTPQELDWLRQMGG